MQSTTPFSQNSSTDLIEFARRYGPADIKYDGAELSALSGDAGFRRYYRLSSTPSLMLVDSPPEKERNLEYVRVNDFLSNQAIRVPRIHAVSFEKGLFAIEDLGDRIFQDELNMESAEGLYGQALDMLIKMQGIESRPSWIEDYSEQKLLEEMHRFSEWFVLRLLGVDISTGVRSLIQNAFDELIKNASEQPQVFVHRDFHCRNLMLVEASASANQSGSEIVTIDFQDSVWGPIAYDLASLCRDCYVRWSQQKVDDTIKSHGLNLLDAGLITREQVENLPRWVDLTGLQRHIKILGVFSRLSIRDNKPEYLDDLPLTLRYVLEVLAKYSESSHLRGKAYPALADFNAWMLDELMPVIGEQSWYKKWQDAGNQLEF